MWSPKTPAKLCLKRATLLRYCRTEEKEVISETTPKNLLLWMLRALEPLFLGSIALDLLLF